MIELAKFLLNKGINVVATGGQKRATHSWSHRQNQLTRLEDLPAMFEQATGLATLNSRISGGLMALDFEGSSHGVECVFHGWRQKMETESKPLTEKLIYHSTGGGGVHICFCCPDAVKSNQYLAKTKDGKVLIELRGEGGYALCPPSPGYAWLVGDWDSLSVITSEELEYLLLSCRQLDQSASTSTSNPITILPHRL